MSIILRPSWKCVKVTVKKPANEHQAPNKIYHFSPWPMRGKNYPAYTRTNTAPKTDVYAIKIFLKFAAPTSRRIQAWISQRMRFSIALLGPRRLLHPYQIRDAEWAGLSEWATGLERAPLKRLWTAHVQVAPSLNRWLTLKARLTPRPCLGIVNRL